MQILMNGLLQGVLLGTVGVAFALVYRTTHVFFIALGGIMVLAPYVAMTLTKFSLSIWLACAVAVGISALVGMMIEVLIHWPLARKNAPTSVQLIASLGVYLTLVQCVVLVWGTDIGLLRIGLDATWGWLNFTFARGQTLGPLVAISAIGLLLLWSRNANMGIELRALSDSPVLVAVLGRNIQVIRIYIFCISCALGAVVALAQAWDVGFDAHSGLNLVLLGMVGMVIGGTGIFIGPMLGGILVGIVRAEIGWFISVRWEEPVTFSLLALFLLFRPQGIFVKQVRIDGSI